MKTAYEWRMVMDSTNKPYSWVKNGEYVLYIDKPDSVFNYIPLYTHLAKTLTDEEMIGIYEKDWSGIKCGLGRAVEQAILRKAQEK
jgi:hypothetical protein